MKKKNQNYLFETTLTKQAKIKYPIICGAMYPCSNPELVAAASEGGGIAILQPISLIYVHGWNLRDGIKYIRNMTDKPIGFNALIEKGSKRYMDRMSKWIDIALEEGIRFFVTSLGKPDWVCKRVHEMGGFVYHDVTNRLWAQKGQDNGVDGLICVNNRAGGHLGDYSMENMYNDIADLGLPMICAGGIGSEVELKKAINLGYQGVQMGTRFIATNECNTSEDYKAAIIQASEEDIVMTKKMTLNYTEGKINSNCLISKTRNFRAHEFHYSKIINVPKDSKFLYDLKIGEGISSHKDALTEYNVVASYCHLYFDSAKFASNLIKNTLEI